MTPTATDSEMISRYPTLRARASRVLPRVRDGDRPGDAGPPLPSADATGTPLRRLRSPRGRGVRRGLGPSAVLLDGRRAEPGDHAPDPRGRRADLRLLRAPGDDHD